MKQVHDVDAVADKMAETLGNATKAALTPPETVKLSVSVAKELVERTPLHAWQKHRLLGGGSDKSTDATEDGKIFESIIFNLGNHEIITGFNDYKKDAAKAARDASLAAGRIPVLEKDFPYYGDAAMQVLGQIHAKGVKFEGGKTQVTLIWNSPEGVECKGILDYLILGPDFYIIYDLKMVEDARPFKLQRAIVDYGWDMQHAAYIQAVETLYPHLAGRGQFRFVFCEKKAPYAVHIPELGASMAQLGRNRWTRANNLWKPCLESNNWPGYGAGYIDALPYQMENEELAELRGGR